MTDQVTTQTSAQDLRVKQTELKRKIQDGTFTPLIDNGTNIVQLGVQTLPWRSAHTRLPHWYIATIVAFCILLISFGTYI